MKTRLQNRRCRAAIVLVECLVYITVFAILTGMAFSAYHRFNSTAFALRQSAADIGRSLQIGELWRQDIRKAIAAPEIERGDALALRIPQPENRNIIYSFKDETVWRQAGDGTPVPVLKRVKQSSMQHEQRVAVNAWRWELELKTLNKSAKLRPIFSFQAVAPVEVK